MPVARANLQSSNTCVSQWLVVEVDGVSEPCSFGNPQLRMSITWRSFQNHRPPTLTTNSRWTQWDTFTLLCSMCKAALGLHRWAQTTRAVEVQELPGIILPGILMHFVGDEVDEVCQVVKQYDYSSGCSNISQQYWLSPIWALVSGFGSQKVGHPHSERILQTSSQKQQQKCIGQTLAEVARHASLIRSNIPCKYCTCFQRALKTHGKCLQKVAKILRCLKQWCAWSGECVIFATVCCFVLLKISKISKLHLFCVYSFFECHSIFYSRLISF